MPSHSQETVITQLGVGEHSQQTVNILYPTEFDLGDVDSLSSSDTVTLAHEFQDSPFNNGELDRDKIHAMFNALVLNGPADIDENGNIIPVTGLPGSLDPDDPNASPPNIGPPDGSPMGPDTAAPGKLWGGSAGIGGSVGKLLDDGFGTSGAGAGADGAGGDSGADGAGGDGGGGGAGGNAAGFGSPTDDAATTGGGSAGSAASTGIPLDSGNPIISTKITKDQGGGKPTFSSTTSPGFDESKGEIKESEKESSWSVGSEGG